jgi:hypothetical protein
LTIINVVVVDVPFASDLPPPFVPKLPSPGSIPPSLRQELYYHTYFS